MASTSRWKLAQKAELIWWRNYLRKRDPSTYRQWKLNYWRNFLNAIEIDISKIDQENVTVLDAGCGPAGIFMAFDKADVVACDPLIEQYNKNLIHFKKANYKNVSFDISSLEMLSDSNAFDYVFCLNAINHVKDIFASLRNLTKSLKENGQLIISVDVHNYSLLKYLFGLLPGDILHPQQNDISDYKKMFSDFGLRIAKEKLVKREMIFSYFAFVLKKDPIS